MGNPLVISGIGMLLLFLALGLLYGLMVLMTGLIKDRPPAEEAECNEQEAGDSQQGVELERRRVAAIAVSLARAEQELSPIGTLAVGEPTTSRHGSPWWAFHHQRQLALVPRTRRAR